MQAEKHQTWTRRHAPWIWSISRCCVKWQSNDGAGITDPSKRYYYFTRADQTAKDVFATFILPKGVTCARCVMQWRWVTGNSCYGEQSRMLTSAAQASLGRYT